MENTDFRKYSGLFWLNTEYFWKYADATSDLSDEAINLLKIIQKL